ncbi:MAG: hypothetical protein JKY50_14620 [Oleispira sp.]|nr:hypothetical protein [Oleispira sp.]MBL4882537.1 hypothetical protein [Oleispira sp.]
MKFLLAKIVILCTLLPGAFVNASGLQEGSLAKEIILFEANSYRVVTEFNVYSMQKDKVSEQRLFDVLSIGDRLSLLFSEQSKDLVSNWDQYRAFAWQKHVHAEGDTYVFNDMRILHRDLLAAVTLVKNQLNTDLLPNRDLNKINAILLIEQLASEYLELSAATFGTFGFAGSEQAIQIEVRSAAFERTIQELAKLYAEDTVKLKAVKKVALRWRFIKNTLLAYNERSAPFAVSKTVGYIRTQLAAI